MVDFIKCISEVNDDGVCLVTYVHVSEKSIKEISKLGFAGDTFAEVKLVGVEDILCFQVTHEVTHNDVFH